MVLLLLGVDACELAECVARVGAPVGMNNVVALVDHQHGWHVRDRVELGNDVLGVDQNRIGNPVTPSADRWNIFVDGDSDHLEVVISEFFLECLPTWQIEEAPSPR